MFMHVFQIPVWVCTCNKLSLVQATELLCNTGENVHSLSFRVHSAYKRHETFRFMMSPPAMSFGDRFCFSRKGGVGGGGWVYPKGANSIGCVWARQ